MADPSLQIHLALAIPAGIARIAGLFGPSKSRPAKARPFWSRLSWR